MSHHTFSRKARGHKSHTMRTISTLCLLFMLQTAYSQHIDKYDLHPCGTGSVEPVHIKPEVLLTHRNDSTVLYVPLTLHATAADNGLGRIRYNMLFDAVCRLNADYVGANMKFFWEGDVDVIDSTALHVHSHVNQGGQMMITHNVPNTVNSYFVSSAANNCGYNLPWGFGVVNAISCSGPNDHTWAHELGHFFKLPHPFMGWEGIAYNPSQPTPTMHSNDAYTHFLSEPVWNTDTSIYIDFEVETMDGANCLTAADKFCDTKPDYLSSRWPCGADKQSITVQKDPNGVEFKSDGRLFMSYAYDNCQDRFSNDEIARMRYVLQTTFANYLYNQSPGTTVANTQVVVSAPAQDDTLSSNGCFIQWNAVENATHYIVEVSRFASFPDVKDYLVSNNYVYLPELQDDRNYFIRIRAINRYDACTTIGPVRRFYASSLVTGVSPTAQPHQRMHVWPNPATDQLHIEWPQQPGAAAHILIYNSMGQIVWQQTSLQSPHRVSLAGMPQGPYYIVAQTGGRTYPGSFIKSE
jgi:hypothetical protein